MSITAVNTVAPAAQNVHNASATSASGAVTVQFGAGSAGPLDQVGSGVMSVLKNFEASRSSKSQAMSGMIEGPANPVDAAKEQLISGPASSDGLKPASSGQGVDMAMRAMTRSFDYAIETQLIVKTGSQISTSANSMMRGQ